jgi:hypothetical protein
VLRTGQITRFEYRAGVVKIEMPRGPWDGAVSRGRKPGWPGLDCTMTEGSMHAGNQSKHESNRSPVIQLGCLRGQPQPCLVAHDMPGFLLYQETTPPSPAV